MKLLPYFRCIIGFVTLVMNAQAKKLGENEGDNIVTGKEVIPKSTYDEAESMINGALREIMQEFSSHVTALHDPMFFSKRRFPLLDGSKGYSSWDPFSIAGSAQSVTRWSPRFEVLDDEDSFAIKVDVPGFHFHEMDVELESGGRVLSISGTKEEDINNLKTEEEDEGEKETVYSNKEHMHFSSHTTKSFRQKFTLDPTIDSSKMSANLDPEHGTLVIRAPRKQREIETKRHIPITQFDELEWEELISGDIE